MYCWASTSVGLVTKIVPVGFAPGSLARVYVKEFEFGTVAMTTRPLYAAIEAPWMSTVSPAANPWLLRFTVAVVPLRVMLLTVLRATIGRFALIVPVALEPGSLAI